MDIGIGEGLGIAGALFGAAGRLEQGQAASRQANYQSAVARNAAEVANVNAMIERNNALMRRQDAEVAEAYATKSLVSGGSKVLASGLGAAARLGRIKAVQAGAGVDVNTGSNLDVRAGTRELAKLDAETLSSDAQWENYGLRQRARNLRYEADVSDTRAGLYGNQAALDYSGGQFAADTGTYATEGAALGALGSLASSASSLPLKWSGGSGTSSGQQYGPPSPV